MSIVKLGQAFNILSLKKFLSIWKKKNLALVYIYLTLGGMNIMSYIYGHLIFPSDSSAYPPLPTWYILKLLLFISLIFIMDYVKKNPTTRKWVSKLYYIQMLKDDTNLKNPYFQKYVVTPETVSKIICMKLYF